MKLASIYKMPEGYLIYGLAATVVGASIASEPFIYILKDEANAGAIAQAIKASLCHDDSQKVPFPKNWTEFNQSILKKTGLKSLRKLDDPKTKLISIKEDGGKISFLPTRPAKKPDKGHLFMSEDEAIIISATASNEEIVAAYELAVSKCG